MDTFNPKEIFNSYIDCRKRKRKTQNTQNFEHKLSTNIVKLVECLNDNSYSIDKSICFVVRNPKPREVYAADFRDRIVHHLVVRKLEEYWENQFIYDSYACRKEKGNLAAVDRLHHFMLSVSNNNNETAYFLQCDIKNFFMTIDKNILWKFVEQGLIEQFKNDNSNFNKYAKLTKQIIFHDPTKNYINKSAESEWKYVSVEKRLENSEVDKGIPIGNLTSQFFANIYLNGFDHFVKHTLKCKYYVRYVDDFVLIDKDRNKLKEWKKLIEEYLMKNLELNLKSDSKLSSLSCGINFLGYVQHIHYRLVRRRVINTFKKKIEYYGKIEKNYENIVKLRATLNSYLAIFNNANGFDCLISILKNHRWIKDYFKVTKKKVIIKMDIEIDGKKIL